MSTPCIIAVKTEKGYLASYCHFDGYTEYMYPMLTENYNTYARAFDLVSLGDASSISERMVPSMESGHCFDKPEEGVCVFYHRDRGEPWEWVKPELYSTLEKFRQLQAYVYVYENDCWEAY